MTATQLLDRLTLDADQIFTGDDINEDYSHDECVNVDPVMPAVLLKPKSADEVSQILTLANELRVPVTCRGAGTGLSGAAIPDADGILLSLERMASIIEIDPANHVAVVQPGVTLGQLDERARAPRPRSIRSCPVRSRPRSAATSPPMPAACGP